MVRRVKKESMNICNKCKMVRYCNVACKKKHKSKHKKKCKRRVAELHDEALFSEPPLREDCPICFLPMPFDAAKTLFKPCCGKLILMTWLHSCDVDRGHTERQADGRTRYVSVLSDDRKGLR